VDLTIAALV